VSCFAYQYTDVVSVKFQITLPEDLAHRLKTTAAKHGVPLAQYIRETMEAKVREENTAKARRPLAWLDDLVFDSGETDISSRVDEIVYGGDPHTGGPPSRKKA